jgi:hypothetical protein
MPLLAPSSRFNRRAVVLKTPSEPGADELPSLPERKPAGPSPKPFWGFADI